MNQKLRDLIDKRAKAWSQVQDIQARREKDGYESTQEDGETYTRALDDVENLSQQIEQLERSLRLENVMKAPVGDLRNTNPKVDTGESNDAAAAYRTAFNAYLRRGMTDIDQESRAQLQKAAEEFRALAAGTTTAGGYTVPETFLTRMTEARKAFGGIASLAETLTTSAGEGIVWPKNDDTSNVGAILAENTQVSEQDTTFGQMTLGAYMYTSKLVRISFQLVQDSAFDLEAWLARKLGERIGRASAAHFAAGSGTGQPEGIIEGLTLSQETAASTAISYDDLVDLEHKIDPAYRTDRCRYVVHDTVVKALRKVKDTTGRPLWAPAITVGAPSTINGHPYTVDNGLETLAAGSRSAVFGDINAAYIVREVTGAGTLRLAERYADYLQIGFLGYQRLEGKVQDTSAAAVLTTKAGA